MVTRPSRMKSQRQLARPATPFMLAMALASRPPNALETSTEHQKKVKRFWASSRLYQKLIR